MNEYALGSIVKGLVTEIAPYGAFVELEDGTRGLLHISEISTRFVSDINEILKLGQVVKVKIITIDTHNGYLRFSLKQMPTAFHQKSKARIRVKLPDDEINFAPLKEALPHWIKQALAGSDKE